MESSNTQITPKLYQYRDSGLENVWLEGGFLETNSPYGPGVMIEDMEGLHRCIARCLVRKNGPLTGAEFRFLRTELDLSQLAVGELCGRGERTVRDWENGTGAVDEPANTIIRVIYEERSNPSARFEGLSKEIKRLQALDKQLHELKLRNTADGWQSIECSDRRVA